MSLQKHSTLLSLALALIAPVAIAAAPPSNFPPAIELKPGISSYSIHEAQVIADPTDTLEIEQILDLEAKAMANWAPTSNLNFGFSTKRYWLKIPITNQASSNTDWVLESAYPMIQDLRFYQVTNGKRIAEQRLGRLKPFAARPVDHWSFVFDLSAPKGTRSDLYVMFQSVGHLDAAMNIYTHNEFLSKSIRKMMGMGLYCGIIFAMVLYNLFLFITIRDRNYLFYIVYATTLCLLQCTLNGTTYQFLWPNWVAWNNISAPIFAGVGYIFLGLFTKSLLQTKRLVPKLDMAVNATIAAAIILIVWSLFLYGVNTNRFTSLLQIGVPLILLPVSLTCAWMGSPVAIYYSIAFGFFFLGSGILATGFLGWLPRSFLTVNSMYFGSAAETILLSLALAARIKVLKDEKLESELAGAEVSRQLSESQKKLERQLAVSALASQVAHDIKSPLAALDVVERDLSQLGEGTRLLVRSAVGRIRDIANNLIETNREIQAAIDEAAGAPAFHVGKEPATIELISSHIDPLITEKRLQFRGKIGIEIEARLGAASYGLFARIVPTEFKRDLSNLINNAVEAVGDKGLVRTDLTLIDGQVVVRVRDNGKGIAPDLLARLGRRGETHGKPDGLGLGIHHAKLDAEAWGGSLDIQSEPGKGTTILLRLPQAQPPAWFVPKLDLKPGSPVVVLDDDSSIHQVWQGRFDALRAKERGVEILHFSTPAEFRAWVRGNPGASQKALYLMDYELVGHTETGLSLIEELNLGDRAILVTSHSDEKKVLSECLRLNARMIPKGLAGFVPVGVDVPGGPRTGPDAVLVDDDALVHMTWKLAAKSKGIELLTFSTSRELLTAVGGLPKNTPFYLDSELGDGIEGKQVAQDLYAQGFLNLYLATGRAPDSFPQMPWIKQVVGKEPPWS